VSNGKPYDLEERTFNFASDVRVYCSMLNKRIVIVDDIKQVVRSSGSVGANYIEAKENLGERDRKMKLKICRKEAKESSYWLRLLNVNPDGNETTKISEELQKESLELVNIFSSMINKS